MMKCRFLVLAGITMFLLGMGGQALANTPAVNIDNSTGIGLGNPPFTLGWKFSTNSAISVTGLGVFDDSQDGLAESHEVGIWNSNGNLLASTTVAIGTTDPLINQFRYSSIIPITLAAGQDYFVGALWPNGVDNILYPGDVSNFSTISSISFVQNGYFAGFALACPTDTVDSLPAYFGPNFNSSAVPEPATMLLLGLGLVGLVGVRRKFKK